MVRRFLPLVFVLAIVSTACAEAVDPELQFGSGRRFVPLVADPLNDAGAFPSVAASSDGAPLVGYFAFEEETEEGELPATRPVGSPTLPGVMMATVNDEGIWTRGAIAMQAQIPTVNPAFSPAVDGAVGKLTANNVTGSQMVADGETFHAAWGSSAGLFYATGSTDPAATTQVELTKVAGTPPRGLSIGLDDSGSPVIAFYTSTSSAASVSIATQTGSDWSVDSIADAAGCDACTTAVATTDGGAAVAYTNGGNGVAVATNDGENGWVSFDVSDSGGAGLSAAATADGVALAYYDGASVVEAEGSPTGPFQTSAIAEAADGSADAVGARTSIAAAEDGTTYVAWQDAETGIRFASSGEAGFNPIETAPDTEGGEMPSVAVTQDGSRAFLAWYDPEEQDLLVGIFGEVEGLALAERSPTPSGPPEVAQPPANPDECEPVVEGSVSVQATGIAFDTTCLGVPADEAFQIDFGNQDAGVQHNISIYPSAEDLQNPLFQGELISGPDSITYDVDPLEAGEYYLHCDVHPAMSGSVQVGEDGGATGATGGATGTTGTTGGATGTTGGGATGASGATGDDGGGGGGADGTTTVVAQSLAFDTSEIALTAGQESTLTFDNQDAGVPHNIAIFPSETELTEPIYRGETITGPDQIDYDLPSLEAGEYYFHCDVHPNMNGTVTVA